VNTPEPILRVMQECDPDVCLLASQYSLIEHANALKQRLSRGASAQCEVRDRLVAERRLHLRQPAVQRRPGTFPASTSRSGRSELKRQNLIDQNAPTPTVGPELRRDRRLHGAHIGEDLGLGMRADDQHRGDVRRRRELKRCALWRRSSAPICEPLRGVIPADERIGNRHRWSRDMYCRRGDAQIPAATLPTPACRAPLTGLPPPGGRQPASTRGGIKSSTRAHRVNRL
jgi:hypothetical protein